MLTVALMRCETRWMSDAFYSGLSQRLPSIVIHVGTLLKLAQIVLPDKILLDKIQEPIRIDLLQQTDQHRW